MGARHCRKMDLTVILLITLLAANYTQIGGLTTSSPSNLIPGRSLLQIENIQQADDSTIRIDPLDNFKKYKGGYDITDKHYWSSTIFTGAYGYALVVVWLLCGILYGGYLLATKFCCCLSKINRKKQKKSTCHKHCYIWPILTATLFTILAIVASGLVIGGNTKLYRKTKTVVNIIINTATDASENIYNATGAMKDMRNNLDAYNGGGDVSVFLNSTSGQLDDFAKDIDLEASKNHRLVGNALKIMFIITTGIISLNLIAVVALLVFGILKFQRALRILLILCWILTAFCCFFFGLYLFLEQFAGDTCTALEDFQHNPYNNSLISIVPCDELLSAQSVLYDVSAEIYKLVNQVNEIAVEQTSSDQILLQICNPFSSPPEYLYQPEKCEANTTQIGDIPQVLRILTCTNMNNGTCQDDESNSVLKVVESYTTSIQDLLNSYPGIEGLVSCQSVKDTFSEILQKHCKPLKRDIRLVWISMIFLSIVMMVLVLVWTAKASHEGKNNFLHSFVKPHSDANMLESGIGIDNHIPVQ